MIFILILAHFFYYTNAIDNNNTEPSRIVCDGVIFSEVYYDKEVIADSLGRPYNLVVHKYTRLIFFSHTIQSGSHVDFGIMACHLERKECKDVQGIPGGYAVAYDPGNDDIYLGGHDGIYKYNFLTKSAEFFAAEGKSVWGIFVKKFFYYIEYPTQKLFVYQDDSFVQVAEAIGIEIDLFYISRANDIYFANKTAFYKVEKQERDVIVLSDEVMVRQLAEDSFGDVYIAGSNGIYVEEKPYHRLRKVASIEQVFGLTFDENDNVIFSNKDGVYRLLPSKYGKMCYSAILGSLRRKLKANGNSMIS